GKRFNATVGIIADAADALSDLTGVTEGVLDRPFLNPCKENMRTWNAWLQEDKEDMPKPIRPEKSMTEIENNSKPDTDFSKNLGKWKAWMEEDKEDMTKTIRQEKLMAESEKISEPDTVFSIDVGTSTVWANRYLELNHNQDFLISSWLGTMGCGLPGSIASK